MHAEQRSDLDEHSHRCESSFAALELLSIRLKSLKHAHYKRQSLQEPIDGNSEHFGRSC